LQVLHDNFGQCADKTLGLYGELKQRLERTEMAVFKALLEKGFHRGQGKRVRLLGLNLGIASQPQIMQLALPFD
jgi:hypothetical protein